MKLRAVLLDVGGTLLREVPAREAIYAEVAASHGGPPGSPVSPVSPGPIDPADMRRRMLRVHHGMGLHHGGAFRYSDPWFEAYIARLFGTSVGGLGFEARGVERITAELFRRFESGDTFRLYKGARELLATLRGAGLTLGVLSNWSERLPRVLEALDLASSFDFVLSSAIEGLEKPDPRFFALALERAGVEPAEALHAGDHPAKDVEGARGASIRAVLVDHAGRIEAPHGVPRVESLAELATLVLAAAR